MDFSPLKFAEKVVFVGSFSEKFATVKMRVIATGYTFIGGVYFDERVNLKFRRIWTLYNISSTILVCSSCTFYLMDLTDYDSSAILIGCIPIFNTLTKVFYSLIVYGRRNEIRQVIDFLADDITPSTSAGSTDYGIQLLMKIGKWLFSVSVGVTIALMVYVPSDSVKFTNQNVTTTRHIHGMRYFPMWCPFENTTMIGNAVGLLQGVVVVPDVIFAMAGSAFFFAMIAEIYEKFSTLCEHLVTYFTAAFEQFDRLNAQVEEATEMRNTVIRRNMMYRLVLRRMGLMGIFYADFTRFMRRHQQLQRMIALAMEFMQAYFSMNCLSTSSLGIVVALLSRNETDHWGVQLFGAAFMMFWGWLVCGIVAYFLVEMNNMIVRQVHEMPWYRATVNTFLTTVRQPLIWQVLKVFPLMNNIIVKGLSYVWSLIEILRAWRNR